MSKHAAAPAALPICVGKVSARGDEHAIDGQLDDRLPAHKALYRSSKRSR